MAHRVNGSTVAFASTARTASPTAYTAVNEGGCGICVNFSVTASADTPSVVLSIYGTDAAGVDYLLLAGAAVTGTSVNTYWVFPASTVTANVSANKFLPRNFKIALVHADGDSITYSVSYDILR